MSIGIRTRLIVWDETDSEVLKLESDTVNGCVDLFYEWLRKAPPTDGNDTLQYTFRITNRADGEACICGGSYANENRVHTYSCLIKNGHLLF